MDISERAAGLDTGRLVFGGVFAVANRLQRVLDKVLPEVTAKQFWLMVVLSQFEEPPTLTQLADAADTSHQNVRQTLDKLVAKGFVQLVPDAADRRASRVRVTAEAARWGADTADQADRFMAAMYAGIGPEELDAFGTTLMRLHTNLATAGEVRHGTA